VSVSPHQAAAARDAVAGQYSEGGTALTTAELRRRLRATGGRGRKLRGLASLLRPYRRRIILMFIALTAATAASLAPPPLAKLAIDDGIVPGDVGKLNLVVIAFIVSALVYWGASYAQTYLVGWVGQRALQDLRLRIFAHLQSQPVGFYERRQAGQLISRMTNDVQALDSLVTDSVVTLFQSSLTLIGTMAILLWLDVELALLTFLIFPVMALASLAFRIASADAYARTRTAIGAITANLQESLSGIRVVRSFSQEPRHLARFRGLNERNREVNMTTVNLNAAYFPAVELLSALATVGILLYGGLQAVSGDIEVGVIVAFVAALNLFFDPIQQLSQLYTTYQAGMAALDKVFELLDEEPDIHDAEDAIELPRVRGEIELRDVSFGYGGGDDDDEMVWALRDLSLKVPPGQTVALVGATGAGKSTIAKLVARFYDPTRGAVLVDGHDLRSVTQASLRRQLGVVPQEAFLFSGSITDNIAFGRPDATAEEIQAAARAVGAHDFIAALEHGYDTQVGERGTQLSAGQRQLVAFARALASDPRVLILDEATSNVDLHTEGRIEEGLRRLLAGRTAIVIAHRLSTIRQAGRIVVLDGGRIVEQGTHDELLDAEGAYWRLYRDWMEQAAA
jgi:ATP-binding cassette subfamily B protein